MQIRKKETFHISHCKKEISYAFCYFICQTKRSLLGLLFRDLILQILSTLLFVKTVYTCTGGFKQRVSYMMSQSVIHNIKIEL